MSKEVVAQRGCGPMDRGSVKLSTGRIDHEASSAWRRWIVRSGGYGGRRAAIDGTGARNKVKRLASTRLASPLLARERRYHIGEDEQPARVYKFVKPGARPLKPEWH